MRTMRIFAGFPGVGTSNDSGVIENGDLSASVVVSSEPVEIRPTLLYSNVLSLVGFPLTPKYMTLNGHFTLNSVLEPENKLKSLKK